MYACSSSYRQAIANGNEQKALLIFSDCVFTDDDIVIDAGIQLNDNFNMEEDLCIGQATSNELMFRLVNDNRLLNSYTFGDFTAVIGVYLNSSSYSVNVGENVRIVVGNNTYEGYSTYPYIKRNGAAMSSQPGWAVMSILCYDGKVYAFGANGQYMAYNNTTGNRITDFTLNSFMTNKVKNWARKGFYYDKSTRILKVWKSGKTEDYEFCPLGWFTAERPKAPDQIEIQFTCYDFMQKFEKDMKDVSVTYPITIQNLFIRLCTVAEVEYELPSPFINGSAVVHSKPADFDNATMRDVIKWIAEAAGSNARFNRDGKLTLDWLRSNTGQSINESGYREFKPYWYETKQITKLYNRSTQDDTDTTYGTGDEAYLIQDNPLLRGVT